ncbi:MAG: response regulator [Treponema sp.]|nr:response regulator [Treponema sp.]
MYSVFIVDDETIVREGLRSKIDWEHSIFTFAGEAGDGEIALSMIQDIKPDILITDIKMPFMDGLELAQTVKKLQPWIRIIILSGHDEFDYAKRAISIGVEDYILKPFTLDEMIACLTKVASELDKQKQQFTDIARMKRELESSYMLSREKLLSDVVLGTIDSSTAIRKASDFNINLVAHYYIVCVSMINSKDNDINQLIAAKSYIIQLTNNEQDIIGFFLAPNTFVAIVKNSTKEFCEDRAFNYADTIQHELSKNTGCTIVTAIGPCIDHFTQIANSFQDASYILKQCHFSDKNKIIGSNDINKSNDSSIVLQENDPLVDRLNYADESEIDQIITEYIALLGENPDHFSIIASYLLVDVIMAVSKVIEELGGNIKEVMPEILTHSFVDNAVKNEKNFICEIRRVLTSILQYRNAHIQGRYADVILRAKKYIDKNYADPDICLHSTAEAVNFSPNHFSTIFSQECKTTFIEYLTSVRIEQAKKLLKSTDMKSADIAYEVGFNDPHYFSFIFKKVTGVSPRDYRNM